MRTLPVALSIAAASVLARRLVQRLGTTPVVAAGLAADGGRLRRGSRPRVGGDARTWRSSARCSCSASGSGSTTAPATESIMGSLNVDKAGVGSAVNDTTRELGGTLGVADHRQRVQLGLHRARSTAAAACSRSSRPTPSTRPRTRWAPPASSHEQLGADAAAVSHEVSDAFLCGLERRPASSPPASPPPEPCSPAASSPPAPDPQHTAPDGPLTVEPTVRPEHRTKAMTTNNTNVSTIHIPGTSNHYLEPAHGGEGRLRYVTGGHGAPVVMLHTVRTQAEHFRHLIPLVSDRYTVYALDLPGMGYSDIVPGASYDEPTMRRAVTRLLTQLDLHDVTLLGESMGAVLALTATAELPYRVRRVVAINPYDYKGGIKRSGLLARFIMTGITTPGLGRLLAASNRAPSRARSARRPGQSSRTSRRLPR